MATIRPVLQAVVAAMRWEETPCVVDSSSVVAVPSGGRRGPTYRIEVVYHYTFHGRVYHSSRYQFTSGSNSGRDRKQRIVDQYPPGRQTVCYVNPSAPGEAVLYRGLNVEMAFGCFGLIFAFVGGLGFFYIPRLSTPQLASQKDVVPRFAPATGEPVALKPQNTPLGKVLGMLFFAIVWNGFISIFFYLAFFSSSHNSIPIFVKIFVGLFCLIGLLIIAGTVSSFLALFNPQVLLSARTNSVPLGGEFQFQWSIRGRAEKFRKVRVVLEGREEATYQSGKNVSTATQVFAEIPVFETMDHEIMSQGQGRVVIPAGLVHSFKGRHNRIIWRLRVRGEIPHWSDIEEDFTINVLPHGAAA